MRGQENNIGPQPQKELVTDHLSAVLADSSFASSKRCQEFLRYVVSEAIEGRQEEINERNIAHIVFGKSNRFEPSEDSLVRVKAREVRRRLAQYYRDHPASPVRIDLPHGGYSPNFLLDQLQPEPPSGKELQAPLPSRPISRRKIFWYLGGTVAAAAAVPGILYMSEASPSTALDRLWMPVLGAKAPLLISIPVLKTQTPHGILADRVGIGVAAAISRAANFLNAHKIPYRLRFGSGLTFEQLREQPSLLLGGFTSSWGLWATKGLRYNLVAGKQWAQSYIEDSQTRQRWHAQNLKPDGYATADYAIVARLFDAVSGQLLFVAAGITTFGTEGAASVLFDSRAFNRLLNGAPSTWPSQNFEAIVKVSIFGTTPSAPVIVAKHFW